MANETTIEKTTPAPKGVKDLDKALNEFNETVQQTQSIQKQIKKSATTSKKPRKVKKAKGTDKIYIEKGKRKEAIARASLFSNGSGEILLNGVSIEYLQPKEIKEIILEPLNIAPLAKEISLRSRISIDVHGGGVSGRAQAARNALAKAIVKASGSEELRTIFMQYDRNILIDDHRRVEPKKFKGPKARARFQTSYR